MRPSRHIVIVATALATLAAGCGSRVSTQQAITEAREDARRAGTRLAGSTAAGSATDLSDAPLAALPGTAGDTTSAAPSEATGSQGAAAAGVSSGSVAGAAGVAAPAPSGGNGGATDVGVTATEIKLGWVGTLTGPVPGLFRGALIGAQAFAAYANNQGGLFGRQLKVIAGDDSLDSGKNRAAHLKLKDEVFAMMGSFSVNDDGGVGVLKDSGIPDVGGALSLSRFRLPNHFDPQPIPPGWRSGGLRYYKARFPKEVIEHTAFFVSAIESARAIARNTRKVMESLGYKVVYTREVTPNETNYTGDVIQMRNQGVRALMWQGDAGNMARLAAAMHQQGFKVDLPNWGGAAYDDNFLRIAGKDAVEGAYSDSAFSMFRGEDAARIPEVGLFNQWMKRVDPGQIVDLFSMFGWVSGRLFQDGVQKVGPQLTRAKLLAALATIGTWDARGMVGPITVGPKRPSDCYMVYRIKNGKFVREAPLDERSYICDQGGFVYL